MLLMKKSSPPALAAPDFVTHYYRSSRGPFLNLSDLDDEVANPIMAELIEERRRELQHRPFGRKYLEMACHMRTTTSRECCNASRRKIVQLLSGRPLH
jgi:hypothetical protein